MLVADARAGNLLSSLLSGSCGKLKKYNRAETLLTPSYGSMTDGLVVVCNGTPGETRVLHQRCCTCKKSFGPIIWAHYNYRYNDSWQSGIQFCSVLYSSTTLADTVTDSVSDRYTCNFNLPFKIYLKIKACLHRTK